MDGIFMAAFHSAEQVADTLHRWTVASVLGFAVAVKQRRVVASDAPAPIIREERLKRLFCVVLCVSGPWVGAVELQPRGN